MAEITLDNSYLSYSIELSFNHFVLTREGIPQNLVLAIQESAGAKEKHGRVSPDTLDVVATLQTNNGISTAKFGFGAILNTATVDAMIHNVYKMTSGPQKPWNDGARIIEQGNLGQDLLGFGLGLGIGRISSRPTGLGRKGSTPCREGR